MTSITQVVEKITKYADDNNIFGKRERNGKRVCSIFIRFSSFVEENIGESFDGNSLRKYYVFIPLEITICSGAPNMISLTYDKETKTYSASTYQHSISFEELVKIWDGKIPYIKFYETGYRKFNCSKKFYNLAAVRVETTMKEYKDSGVKYYPQSISYMDNRYLNHYNSIDEDVKNKVAEMRTEWRNKCSEPEEFIQPVRTLPPVENDD